MRIFGSFLILLLAVTKYVKSEDPTTISDPTSSTPMISSTIILTSTPTPTSTASTPAFVGNRREELITDSELGEILLTASDLEDRDALEARLSFLITATVLKLINELTLELELNARSYNKLRYCDASGFPQNLKEDIVTCGATAGLDIARHLLGSPADVQKTLKEVAIRTQVRLKECKDIRRAAISFLAHKSLAAKVATLPELQAKTVEMMENMNAVCKLAPTGEIALDGTIIMQEVIRSTQTGVEICERDQIKMETCAKDMIEEWLIQSCPKGQPL